MARAIKALVGLISLGLCGAGPSQAADPWPAHTVRIIVSNAAGGANDLVARAFAEPLSRAFGQQFIVDNRPGGGGIIATELAAHAEPDGYTLIASGMPTHVLVPIINAKNAGYDPVRDFTHIAYFGGPPNVFVVHQSLPVNDYKAFVAYLKAATAGVDYVSPAIGSVGNVLAEYWAARENVKLNHVPYRGGAAAVLDLVAGHVQVGSMTISTALPYIRQGLLRAIAISSAARLPDLPDVPTLAELGHPELIVTNWVGLSGPARLPDDITGKLNAAVNEAMASPKVQTQLSQEMMLTSAMTPSEFTEFVRHDFEKWSAAMKLVNIPMQ